jgi:integrase
MPTKNLTAQFVERVKANGKRTDYFDDSLPGFSLRVSEKGVKSWCVSYRFAGKWTRYTFGAFPIIKLAEARQTANDALHDAAHGINPATKKKIERESETFAYIADEFLERHAKAKKRSWHEDERILNADILPAFGNLRARDITRRDIRSLLEKKATSAPIMANRMRALLRKIFNWAITAEIVESNPVYLVPAPGRERQRERVLTEDEIRGIWKAIDADKADADDSHRREKALSAAIMKLRLITAQRGAEVMSMEWSEFDGDWWTIPGEKTKNGLAHRVPLTAPAHKVLSEIRSSYGDSHFVFQSPKRPDQHISNPQKALERIQKATGIDFVGHDFRRTAASHMTGMGIPRLTVKKILNHVEREVTAVYDRHSYDAEKRAALEEWSRRLILMVSGLQAVQSEPQRMDRSADRSPRDHHFG